MEFTHRNPRSLAFSHSMLDLAQLFYIVLALSRETMIKA